MMTKAKLHSHPIATTYVAPRLSIAYVFSTICAILILLIPFYLCFSPRYALRNNLNDVNDNNNYLNTRRTTLGTPVGIWLKHDTYREQPKVKFQYRVIVVVQAKVKVENNEDETNSTTENASMLPKEIYYSTFDEINEKRPESFRASSTTSREADDDMDGIMDRLLLKVNIPIDRNEFVYGVQALVFVTYKIENHVKMEMESLIHVHYESGIPGSKFTSFGDLNLRQMKAIPIISDNAQNDDDDIIRMYVDEELVQLQSASFEPSLSNVNNILKRYHARSIATDYVERFPMWTRQVKGPSMSNDESGEDDKSFELDLTVIIPKMQSIVYVPTLMEVLTEAWMRYLSLLVVIGGIGQLLFQYVFANQIIRTDVIVS